METRLARKSRAQAAIDAATSKHDQGALSETGWQDAVTDALADAYLSEDDPRWQSGFDGDAELWRQARAFLLDAVPASGSFLDIGCATGYLMECLALWGRERGLELSVYGLELNPRLAEAARRRLSGLADHVFIGNAIDWVSSRRFTYVRTGLEYVPSGRGSALIAHLLAHVVEPRGRLLVGPINEKDCAAVIAAFLDAGALEPGVVHATDRDGKTRYVVFAVARSIE